MSETKTVLFESFPKQEEFIQAVFSGNYEFILYGGAIRGGKTFCGLGTLILLSKVYPGSRWCVVRKTLQVIKQNTYPSWDKIKPVNFVLKHDKDVHTVTFVNGSQIIFFGENYERDKEFNRWRGLEVNGFLLEEINELQEKGYFKAVERCGSYVIPATRENPQPKQPKPLIMATCNPTYGWVKQRFYDKWKNNTLSPKHLYISSKIWDNPFISEEYKESLKQMPQYEYEVFVNGNWEVQLKTGGEFWKNFELEEHVRPVLADSTIYHISMDSNVYPYISITLWQMKNINEVYEVSQVHEICAIDPLNTATASGRLLKEYLTSIGNKETVFIYGDPSTKARNTIDDDKKTFYDKFTDEIKKGHRIQDKMFTKAPSVSATGDFINEIYAGNIPGIKITIGENCKTSISDYIATKQDKDGGMAKTRVKDPNTGVSYEPNGHLSDTKRYFLIKAFESEFQKWQNRFSNPEEFVIPAPNKTIRGGI